MNMEWGLISAYGVARREVIQAGYAEEIIWQELRTPNQVSEQEFLEQYAWVVLSSGMKEAVIRRRFGAIKRAFMEFSSAHSIVRNVNRCRKSALSVFAHERKIEAICDTARWLSTIGIWSVVAGLKNEGPKYLAQLPYMGPATSFHLAKNLGLDVVKPDRHLVRIAETAGYCSVDELCKYISTHVSEKISVVDTVLWRFATLNPRYHELFCAARLAP
ncbi:MAG: hypothetical protein ACOY5W_10500 [Pseudomonadota bacterium]